MAPRPYARPRAAAGDIDVSWTVPDLCRAYAWPDGLAGGGVIALIELAGGWRADDVDRFCATNGVIPPLIADISVDATTNAPGHDPDADGEVALDIQVAAASYFAATGKPATIRIYWTKDIAAGVAAAAAEGCDVCSISWGQDEALWGPRDARALETAIRTAAEDGMVVFAAAGDNDSSDGGPNPANVDLPAGCPHVIGCGGTTLFHGGAETVWNNDPGDTKGEGTGGGFSTLFPAQPWQSGAPGGGGRMVPDLAANADPETGYVIVIAGEASVTGGTSAVAPLFAGLFAAFGRKLGWIAPKLWANHLAFRDIVQGDNGFYRAGPGPDACSGLGSPIGARLAALFVTTAEASAAGGA